MKTLFVLVGESGCGKSTILSILKEQTGFKEVMSFTARPKRHPEENGYFFSDEATYLQHKSAGIIFEEAVVNGYHYWTLDSEYEYEGARFLIANVEGSDHVQEHLKDAHIVVIHIKSDYDTRMYRLVESSKETDRALKIKDAEKRLHRDGKTFDLIKCSYVVANNGHLYDTVCLMLDIINKELGRA